MYIIGQGLRCWLSWFPPHHPAPKTMGQEWCYDDSGDTGMGLLGMVPFYPHCLLHWRHPNVLNVVFI